MAYSCASSMAAVLAVCAQLALKRLLRKLPSGRASIHRRCLITTGIFAFNPPQGMPLKLCDNRGRHSIPVWVEAILHPARSELTSNRDHTCQKAHGLTHLRERARCKHRYDIREMCNFTPAIRYLCVTARRENCANVLLTCYSSRMGLLWIPSQPIAAMVNVFYNRVGSIYRAQRRFIGLRNTCR